MRNGMLTMAVTGIFFFSAARALTVTLTEDPECCPCSDTFIDEGGGIDCGNKNCPAPPTQQHCDYELGPPSPINEWPDGDFTRKVECPCSNNGGADNCCWIYAFYIYEGGVFVGHTTDC